MQIQQIRGATHTLAVDQPEYEPLPIKRITVLFGEIDCPPMAIRAITLDTDEGRIPAMVSEWRPTLQELHAITLGAPIRLSILGTAHPPVMLSVGEPE